jgi:hypothetical protein
LSPPTESSHHDGQVACTGCGHVGLAASETLPRLLTCSACGSSRRVEIAECRRIRNTTAVMERILGVIEKERALP